LHPTPAFLFLEGPISRSLNLSWWSLCLLLGSVASACERETQDAPGVCPLAVPAFRLTLRAVPELPPGTKLTVAFGGAQSERFVLGMAPGSNETVCCGTYLDGDAPELIPCSTAPDAQTDGAGLASDAAGFRSPALVCDLWTNGAAEITVRAAGYPEFTEHLVAEMRKECAGLVTVEIDRTLMHADAGE
jgi:hypothetical protein